MAASGEAKLAWLSTFLALSGEIASHTTFGRLFRRLDPAAFEAIFRAWTAGLRQRIAGEVILIDGECLRGFHDRRLGKHAIWMVSAWARDNNRIVLGQSQVDETSNEITAIPELLRALDVAGCIVSIDAMGTQKDIAAQIMAQGGDYVLTLKESQPHLLEAAQLAFEIGRDRRSTPHGEPR